MDPATLDTRAPNGPAVRPSFAARTRALFPLDGVLAPWLVSRVLACALLVVMATTHGPLEMGRFAKWDGGWYLNLAINGYPTGAIAEGAESAWAFFPLLPWAMRAVHAVGVPWEWTGVVVNHGAFLVALAGVHRIACRHTSPGAARLAVWALALFPGAFLFSMVYPCSLLLAASVWAFLFVEDHHDLAAAVCVLGATMVRPNGFVLAIAIAVAVRFRPRRVLLVCGPSVVAFVGWMIHNHDRTGDALAFYHAKSGWPEVNLIEFFTEPDRNSVPHALLAAATVGALVLVWRRIPRSWLVLTALYLVPPFVVGMVGLGRYAGECFPAFVAAGDRLERWGRAWTLVILATSVVLQAACAYWVIRQEFVP